jgi:hypothetical protein
MAGVIAGLPGLRFCEVIAESVDPAAPPRGVAELRERGIPVIPHGVRLGLGGAEGLDAHRVAHLAACVEALDAPLVSEHVAFTRAGGREAGHLLPVPRTREALDVLTRNVRRVQAELDVPLALEPSSSPRCWSGPTRCCSSTSRTSTPTRSTGAPTRSRCSTGCRSTGSPTCTSRVAPNIRPIPVSTTTRTPTRCLPGCSTCSTSSACDGSHLR